MSTQSAQSKTAIVTGASKGIGRAISLRLADDGCACILVSRRADALDQTAEEIAARTGQRPVTIAVDLRMEDAGTQVAAALGDRDGLDVLVNCAGATKVGQLASLSDADWQDGFALKFHGAVRLTRTLWPALRAARGCVVNIGGDAAFTPGANFMIGGAVNAALEHFSKSLAEMGLRDDVNVNIVHPGMTETDRLISILQTRGEAEEKTIDAVRQETMAQLGIRRLGQPDDVANTVAFLCSEAARHIHGVSLRVDGGATKGLR